MATQPPKDAQEASTKSSGKRPFRNGQNHFPPPKAAPEYATRSLPPLPPKSSPASSSVYDSDEGSCRPTPSRFHRPQESPASNRSEEGTSADFGGSINEAGMAMIRPPGMSIVTDFQKSSHSDNIAYQEVIYSPLPKYPKHNIVKDMDAHSEFDVSPLVSPPTGTFSYQTYEVSPLTPRDTSTEGFQQTIPESDFGVSHYAVTQAGHHSRKQSHWEDIPPAASRSSLGFHSLPVEVGRKPASQQPQFRYSDPGSPFDLAVASTRVPDLSGHTVDCEKAPTDTTKIPRPQSESLQVVTAKSSDASDTIVTSPYSMWTRGYGAGKPSPTPSSSSKMSFAVSEANSFSARLTTKNKPKPNRLHLQGGRTAEEHDKTPYPNLAPAKSEWDYDEEEVAKPKRSSWGVTPTKSSRAEGSSKAKGVGKLVSRVRHAGVDVMSKLSFVSEDTKREKRIEELRGKIQHHRT